MLFLLLVISLIISVVLTLGKSGNNYNKSVFYLGIIILLFFIAEILFVTPFHLIYNDEYIYESAAKTMLYQHEFGICSFSSKLYCVPNTIGFFHEPGGWPFIEAIGFYIFGVNGSVAFGENLLIGIISIIFVFLISGILFDDINAQLMSALIFSFMPLFDLYSRTAIIDMPLLLFELMAIYFSLLYMKTKKFYIGVTAILSAAYALAVKVDGIIIIPILLLVLLSSRYIFSGSEAKKKLIFTGYLIIIFIAVSTPALIFTYIASSHSFGVNVALGQPKFSFAYLANNSIHNALFFLGSYNTVKTNYSYVYHVEFPIEITLVSVIGLISLYKLKLKREMFFLVGWFLIIFLFYSSYYGGGALYGLGADMRYFLSDFACISIIAGIGGAFIISKSINYIKNNLPIFSKRKAYQKLFAVSISIIIIFDSIFQFSYIVSQPPSKIATFSAERADESFLLQQYNKIPPNCTVVTFKPPFWYIMNRSNIYASWLLVTKYNNSLYNISHGCLYFDYGLSCYINYSDEGAPDNYPEICNEIMSKYSTQKIATYHYTNFSWNVTFGLYKLEAKTAKNTT
ncbi:MAG: glycosyltransferase family 39 protein [Candidatus Micrarchaeaceae archaeon]